MNHTTYNGGSASGILDLIPNGSDSFGEVLGPYMYDSMWALALAINETIYSSYTDYEYNFSEALYNNILNQSFSSLTGDVFFHNKLRVSRYAQLVEFTPNGSEFRGHKSTL